MSDDIEPKANLAAEIELKFADGDYLFALKLRQIEELQRLCRAGLGEIVERMWSRRFYAADIVESIRLGLIGGGLPPIRARELVETYVDGRPFVDENDPSCSYAVARAVLGAVYFGVRVAMEEAGQDPDEEDDEGKAAAAMGVGVSTSRPITDRDLFSDLASNKSEDTVSVNGSQPGSSTIDL
jgi:hypothetical protein